MTDSNSTTTTPTRSEPWTPPEDLPWWARWLQRASQPTEKATKFDGVLSYATEWHALIIGVTAGFTVEASLPLEVKALVASALGLEQTGGKRVLDHQKVFREVRDEPWYFMTGLFVGLALGTIAQHAHGLSDALAGVL